MIIDNLFENKKNTNESLADEFMAMARAKGMNPRLRGTPDEERARTDAMLKQRAADRANAPKPQPIDAETRAHLQDQLKSLEATFDPNYEYSDDHSFWKEQSSIAQQINRIKAELSKGVAESRRNKKRKLDESWLMEDPVYRKFKRVGRYIAERKLTEPEILKIFADAETGMTDKATGANRTFLGRGKDTTMDFAGGVADALKGVWSGLQSSTPISFVDVTYDKATDALADLTGGEKGAIMQAIKKYRMLAKEYPKTAGLAKGALVAITGLATGGAGLPAIAAFVYGLDSAVKGDKFSDIALKAGGAAATAWAASKIASMFGGNQPAGAEAGGMGDPSQLPPFDDAGNLSPGFHISPDDKMPYYTGDLAPTPTDIAAGYGPDGVAGLTGAEAAGASRFDDIVKNAIDYKIKDGDTLSQILADKKINPEAFRRLPGNEVYFGPDGNPNIIKAGQTIKLPDPADIPDLNRMSYTTPDPANYARFDKEFDTTGYTGQYNPNNSAYSLDATTNLKQQGMGRLGPDGGIAADRVAADAARASGGPELLGGPGAGDVAASAAAVPTPSPLNLQPPATPGGPQFGTVTLPDGQTLKAAAFPEGGGITPRLPPGSTPVTINYNGQELTGRIVNDTVYFTKFPAAPQISPADIRPFGSGAPDTSLLSTPGGYGGTLSGVTSDQIMASPVYQQAYAQEIARYGAEPSARAIQTAQQIATMKAKAAITGAVREATEFTRTVKMRQLSVDKLIDQKLTTLSWALNESVGKSAGRSMHLTSLGVYTVFENIRRVGEAAVEADAPWDLSTKPNDPRNIKPGDRGVITVPRTAPTPSPAPAPTAPTGDAAGPGREALPDLLRPDMADVPTQPADPAKKSWFGKGLDYLDRGVKKVGGVIGNLGHQLTTGVTKEKLKMNWHQAGKPTDSAQLSAWLVKQGVPIGVVNGVYEKMGLPVSAEPVAATDPAETEPQAKTGGAQRQMAFYGTNPATNKPWTYDELIAKSQTTPTSEPAPVEPDATAKTTPGTLPQPTTTAVGQPNKVTYGKGFEKFMKPKTATQFPAFGTAGTAPAYKTATTPANAVAKTTAPLAPAITPAPVATTNEPMKIGGQTLNPKNPADKKIIDKVQAQTAKVAEALKKPVAEMLTMVETKEDVAKIKQFVDQTFVKYGPMSESAFAVRNQLIEHVTQVGAQRRREHARKSAQTQP